jgi:hypothetical protein
MKLATDTEFYTCKLLADVETGRVLDTLVFRAPNSFIFTPNLSDTKTITADEIEAPAKDVYLEFANLYRKAAQSYEENKRTIRTESLYEDALEEFARKYGPLFGLAGLNEEKGAQYIEEPIEDWKAAQRIMDRILMIDTCVQRGEISHDSVREYLSVATLIEDEETTRQYHFAPGVEPAGLYAKLVTNKIEYNISTNDGSLLCALWHYGDARLATGARFSTVYPRKIFPHPSLPSCTLFAHDLDKVIAREELREEIPSLLKITAQAHIKGIHFGFKNFYSACATRGEGAYTILSESYLSYMWHELASAYSREAFRLCANPKCQRIIVRNTDTSNKKRFCSDRCRAQANNAKITEQEKRARLSFYNRNLLEKIYEDAFGEEYSNSDSRHVVQDKRLEKWIREFIKTKRGKDALRKGDPRLYQWYHEESNR